MTTKQNVIDRELLQRYTDQPSRLPDELRDRIEAAWRNGPVRYYSLADLDEKLNLSQTWVVLGDKNLAVVTPGGDGEEPKLQSFRRDEITAVRRQHGLSCTTMDIIGPEDKTPLVRLRYSHRQRSAMEHLKFILEQQIDGRPVDLNAPDETYAACVAEPIKDAQAAFTHQRLAVVWRLLGYMKPYRQRIAIGMLAAMVATAISLLPVLLLRYVIDKLVRMYQEGLLTAEATKRQAWIILGALAGAYLLRAFCHWVRLRTMAVVGECVARDLRDQLYSHLQRLSLSYFSRKQTGGIISRVSSDTDRLWDFIAFGVVEVSLAAITIIGLSVVLLCINVPLGLVMVLPIPLLLWIFHHHSSRMRRTFLRIWRKWSSMVAVLADTIPGMQVVKSFNREEHEIRRFGRCNTDVYEQSEELHDQWTRFWPLLTLSFHMMTLIVWTLGLNQMIRPQGESTLSVGDFVAFIFFLGMYMHPIETIGMITRMLNRATTSAHRVFEILDTEPKIINKPNAVQLSPFLGRVTFDNVTFAYDPVRQIIRGISFDVQPGEMIGLVGPSGAGKSTIINLIARFYDVTGGRILIDGVDLRDLDAGYYRRHIGIVQQETFLFHGTILDNIRYGTPEATAEEVIAAGRAANAHEFICSLPHGYDTVVGERGHTLSGGERQRVSIARALLCNPRILILDEATSSVDTETEKNIQDALNRLIPGRTVFAIAHRLSTLRRADRLFVIKQGRIVEEGSHEQLLKIDDGVYRKMHDIQQQLHEMYAV
ncbi:MAG: ABC transporter ATP-binding protein [Sedimentisphaerales bacterium]|nr:ABC transporter ATP-binding protein [Sedimentisphaerales bacterium]